MDTQLKHIENLFSQGHQAEAMNLLRSFLEEHPDNVRALNDFGAMLQASGDAPAAEAVFLRALELSPDSREVRSNLALALASGNKWAEAKEHLNKLLAANQNEAKLWTLLAKAEQATGNLPAAIEYLDRSLTLDPDQPEIKQARETLGRKMNDPVSGPAVKPSLLLCCQSSLENFALELCGALEPKVIIDRVIAANIGPFVWPIKSATNVWLEWGAEMSVEVTRHPELLQGKNKVILRLHSFEILGDLAGKINYEPITDVVFVSRYMRDLFLRRFPGRLNDRHRVHVIHNGIDTARFSFLPGGQRSKIAFVGKLDAKKDPMLMLQAFAFLHKRHPELELHVAGGPDADRYYLSMPDMLAKNPETEKACHFYGHVDDIPQWLAGKDFILCTSPLEAQGVGLLEAMHRGLRPLIYNFPGAEHLYPRHYLWNNLDELESLLLNGPTPEECSRFVAGHYSMARQADNFYKVIIGDEPVVEPQPSPLPEEL